MSSALEPMVWVKGMLLLQGVGAACISDFHAHLNIDPHIQQVPLVGRACGDMCLCCHRGCERAGPSRGHEGAGISNRHDRARLDKA